MVVLFLVLASLILYRLRYRKFNEAYLDFDTTDAVKGICIFLVFISHGSGYLADYGYDGWGDHSFVFLRGFIRQWVVAIFLFYSGYGVMESIRKKGAAYVDGIPRHRILTVLLNFDVAVLAFLLLNVCLGNELELKRCLLSFVCWEDLGNSNWYIFAILLCYLATFLAFRLARHNEGRGVLYSTILVLSVILGLYFLKESYWYDTLLCFPAGIIYSRFRIQIENFARKHYSVFFLAILCFFVISKFVLTPIDGVFYNLLAVSVALGIVALTMKFSVGNRPLVWMGRHLFPLYIYQRIPMILLAETPIALQSPLLFYFISAFVTVLIAYLYRFWKIRL